MSFGRNGVAEYGFVKPSDITAIKQHDSAEKKLIDISEIKAGDILKVRPKGIAGLDQVIFAESDYYKSDSKTGLVRFLNNKMSGYYMYNKDSENVEIEKVGHIEFKA